MIAASETVLVDLSEGVATVTLNRPEKLNALNDEMMEALPAAIESVAENGDVRCVVITGAGRAFCAGGDIARMASRSTGNEQRSVDSIRRHHEASRLLHEMPKPTIAMIKGAAIGGGLAIALACDMCIAAESARLGTGFIRVALSGDYGGTWMAQRLVGVARARELYFTGEIIDGREAERIGLVNRVVPDDQLASETRALAERIAKAPPIALAHMKRNMNLALTSDYAALLEAETQAIMITHDTEDHREAVRAFLEKRQPTFSGR